MNRRKLLSMIGATALTPLVPARIFAAGGIVNPDPCGFYLAGERGPEMLASQFPIKRAIGIDPISMFLNITGDNLTR